MNQKEANEVMIERFKAMVEKAQSADSKEDVITFTDCAHKLYITLSSAGAFSNNFENKDVSILGS